MKVAILLPTHADTKAKFTISLAKMLIATVKARPDIEIEIFNVRFSNLLWSRTMLVEKALGWRADYMLWLDADQTFPPDTLLRLLARDLDFVAANIAARGYPTRGTAFKVSDLRRPILTTKEKAKAGELEEVDRVGFGVTLMRMRVIAELKRLADQEKRDVYPIFAFPAQGSGFGSEDHYFCDLAKRAGVRIFVDHAVSGDVGHIYEIELTSQDTVNQRLLYEAGLADSAKRPA